MAKYTVKLSQSVIYSIGDTHACGGQILEFVQKLTLRSERRGEEARPAFVQLGDLCDGFAFPEDRSIEALKGCNQQRLEAMPELKAALFKADQRFIDWERDAGIRHKFTAQELLASTQADVVEATYQAFRCFETLMLYSRHQQWYPEDFYVIFGNHDADLLRGRCAYGRQQKYILLALLGFSPDEVVAHMREGRPELVLRHPWLKWLSERPHIAMSRDTVYMHGGPTGELGARFERADHDDFNAWLEEIDDARANGWDDPHFTEHKCFLSPDGADNDWLRHPERVLNFLAAAQCCYCAVGHSPFLDFEKGPMLDLANSPHKKLFATPAQLPPEGRLIKHDTNMKRVGELWACRHETGTDVWTGIDEALKESALRPGFEN